MIYLEDFYPVINRYSIIDMEFKNSIIKNANERAVVVELADTLA